MSDLLLNAFPEGPVTQTYAGGPLNLVVTQNYVIDLTSDTVTTDGPATLRIADRIEFPAIQDTLITRGKVKVVLARANVFRQFSIFGSGMEDPAKAMAVDYVSGVAAYDSAAPSAFRRISMRLALPEDSDAWKRAAYIAPGIRVAGMLAGEKVHVDAAQVEWGLGASAPTAYAPARALKVSVRPNRLNWAPNPACEVDTSDWVRSTTTGVTLTRDTATFWQGTASLRLDFAEANAWVTTGTTSIPAAPGQTWTMSAYVYGTGKVEVGALEVDSTGTTIATNYSGVTTLTGGWKRLSATLTTDPGTTNVRFRIYTRESVAQTVYVDGVLIEQSGVLDTYFDGASGSDYLWEQGGTAGKARSYYYKDYTLRSFLLRQVLAENCPLGTIPSKPEYAVLPKT